METVEMNFSFFLFFLGSVLSDWMEGNPTKKSRRDDFPISDNLWEWSSWEQEFNQESHIDLDFDDRWKTLPEELVEKIMAMMPYPYLFKARVLSKLWLARLSPISSKDDKDKKDLAISFHKQLRQWSPNWTVFCPVQDFREDDLLGFDRSSQNWQRLPSLSFVHESFELCPIHCSQMQADDGYMLVEGSLILWAVEEDVYVANILTREWKKLPLRPYHDEYWSRVILCQTLETYKVIMLPFLDGHPELHYDIIQIYDSGTASWSTVKVSSSIYMGYVENAAYVDGVLYFVTYLDFPTSITVLSLSIKVENFGEESVFLAESNLFKGEDQILRVHPVICNTSLLVIIVYMLEGPDWVMKIDLGSKQLLGVSPGPPNYPLVIELEPVSDGDYIFAKVEVDGSGVLAYNVHTDQWELLPYLPDHLRRRRSGRSGGWWTDWMPFCSFRPGLNPFAVV